MLIESFAKGPISELAPIPFEATSKNDSSSTAYIYRKELIAKTQKRNSSLRKKHVSNDKTCCGPNSTYQPLIFLCFRLP